MQEKLLKWQSPFLNSLPDSGGWGKMRIPNSVTVNTGEQEAVYETIDRFFEEAEKRVNIKGGPSKFELRVLNLCELTPNIQPSDNYAHILFCEEKIIAAVFETRTEMNYIHFDYFLNISKIL